MIKELISAIGTALAGVVSEAVPVRLEPLPQGRGDSAYFFIKPLNMTTVQFMGARQLVRVHFDVRYTPKASAEEPIAELSEGMLAMSQGLRRICLRDGQTKKAQGLHAEIVDGVLHVLMGYDFLLTEEEKTLLVKSLALEYISKG